MALTPDEAASISKAKLPKTQFRCFECRAIFMQRDGDWFDWSHMQVHLCRGCERTTRERPERGNATHKR